MKFNIRLLYLYLFSFIGLLICVIGSVRLVELAMKVFIFKGADQFEYSKPVMAPEAREAKLTKEGLKMEEEDAKMYQERENKRQRQREVSGALAMIIIGIPLYLYHWKTIQNENKTS